MRIISKAIFTISFSLCLICSGCLSPWAEYDCRFYTTDLARAQAEIPFTIVLPKYLPDKSHNPNVLPEISGPLKECQRDNKIDLNIFYGVKPGGENRGTIFIFESNYRSIPPDPATESGVEYIEIGGIRMVKSRELSDLYYFYFNQNEIYFEVTFHDFRLPIEEAIKLVESMVK